MSEAIATGTGRARSKSIGFHFAGNAAPAPSHCDGIFPPTPNDAAQTFLALGEQSVLGEKLAVVETRPALMEVVVENPPIAIGLQPDYVYEAQMNRWRASVRSWLVGRLQWESEVLAAMQETIRRPFLDTYFLYTSSLGTHTFFMIILPCSFFFGFDRAGHGLINQLGMGVYLSSLMKDLVCSPRPFAPPVTRLSIGSHHLEYGFPSTHSTNSVTIALHFWSMLYAARDGLPLWFFATMQIVLALYAFSIVFGRLYCGMHSFSDCATGVLLGAGIWVAHSALADPLHAWLIGGGWQVPLISILACLFAVNQHAEPVDDCPCFEDAIAFIAVMMGGALSTWWRTQFGFEAGGMYFVTKPPEDWLLYGLVAVAKLVFGVAIIFSWRLIAKPTLHAILPPIFRGASTLFALPSRRFYIPATDYRKYPHENLLHHPIPSVIDLPAMNEDQLAGAMDLPTSLRRRTKGGGEKDKSREVSEETLAEVVPMAKERDEAKRYDANVLTKVIVYGGIGFLASGLLPVLFECIGWGVYQH